MNFPWCWYLSNPVRDPTEATTTEVNMSANLLSHQIANSDFLVSSEVHIRIHHVIRGDFWYQTVVLPAKDVTFWTGITVLTENTSMFCKKQSYSFILQAEVFHNGIFLCSWFFRDGRKILLPLKLCKKSPPKAEDYQHEGI